tara:strand:+ start:773 stop:1156 length:384 start_codon:yes stop_codon:yes gene_type:complete
MSNRPQQLLDIQIEAYALFQQKNTDYGDAFANHGPIGVLVRLGDKIQRLQKISRTNVQLVKTESLRDTLIDLHNYAAMAVMLLDEDEQVVLDGEEDGEYYKDNDLIEQGEKIEIGDINVDKPGCNIN